LKGRIQVSSETAALLSGAGKSHWLSLREDRIHAKGKGEMTTFWLQICRKSPSNSIGSPGTEKTSVTGSSESHLSTDAMEAATLNRERLVDWVHEIMLIYVVKLVKSRSTSIKAEM
jgi:hypothetical protein